MYGDFHSTRAALAAGQTTCEQTVLYFLERIKATAQLNAFLEVYESEALDRAKSIDEKIKSGTAGPLAGMVLGNKDVLNHKGHPTTSSSKILGGYKSLYNATAVQRLLDADAMIIGRCNCDEFAMGSSNENSAFGPARNALDEARVPGGSSGGSAVAVQAGLCHAATGTDTGGSIRQPASFTGTFGIKPTYGRVSRYGLIAYASSFDQIGVFTNTVDDAALLLEVMSGKDSMDATTADVKVDAYTKALQFNDTVSVAWYSEALNSKGLDPEIKQGVETVLAKLRDQGHAVNEASFDMLDVLVPTYYILTTAEASSNLARFDGIRYGFRSENAHDLESTYRKNRSEGFGEEVKRRIMLGTFVLSAGYYDAYYTKAQKARRVVRERTEALLKENEFIVLPTTPTTAFKIGEKTDDPIAMYLADIYTVQAPIAGLPAVSLPLGKHSNGLPYGVQVIGRRFGEARLLAFSKYLVEKIGLVQLTEPLIHTD